MFRKKIIAIVTGVFLALLLSMGIEGQISGFMDGDGDGVPDSTDLCPFEDASYFDRDGDGCPDQVRSARHVEYWDADDMPFVYAIHEGGAPGIDDGSDFAALQAGMNVWAAVPGTDFSLLYGGTTAQSVAAALDRVNLVTFEDDEYYFPSAVLAVGISTSFTVDSLYDGTFYRAGQILDADMIFNPSKTFVTATAGSDGADIASIAAHEAGHLFGISHAAVWTSTLFFVLGPGGASADLEREDELMFLRSYPDSATLATSSRLGGTVADGLSGEPIPGAIVFAVSASTGDTLGCDYTLPDGSYLFLGLPDGEYYVDIYPLDASAPIGYMQPGHVNWLVASTAVTSFKPESWDLAESFDDDPSARDAVAVSAGAMTTADLVTDIDVTPPAVVEIIPESGAVGVYASAVVLARFSEPIDPETIAGNFRLVNTSSLASVGGSAGVLNGDSLIAFAPSASLAFSTRYELTIDAGIADRFGNPLGTPFVASFTTEAEPPLHVAGIVPASASAGSVVIFTGTGFDPDPDATTVHFAGADAVPVDASATALVVWVPPEAETGEVTIENSLGASNGILFTVLPSSEVARIYQAGVVGTDDLPRSLAVTPDGAYVYVATAGGLLAAVADPGNPDFLAVTKIDVAGGLTDLDVTPDGKRVYGVCRTLGLIHVFDSDPGDGALFNTRIATLSTGKAPLGVLIEPTGTRAFVPVEGGAVQIWDVSRSSASVHEQVGVIPPADPNILGKMAIDPAGERLLVPTTTGRLLAFDLASLALVAEAGIGSEPRDVAIDPAGMRAYVSDEAGNVSVISLAGVSYVQDIPVGGSLRGVDITPAGQFLYVANRETNVLGIVDLREDSPSFRHVVATIPQGINPVDVALSPNGLYAYSIAEEERILSVAAIGVGPAFRSLSRRAGPVGTKLVIAGSDFEGPCAIDFTGSGDTPIRAVPERSSGTALVVAVPEGGQSGPVSVVDGEGKRSNSQYFEALGPTPEPGRVRLMYGAGIDPAIDAAAVMAIAPSGDQAIIGTENGQILCVDLDPSSSTYNQTLHVSTIGSKAVTALAVVPDGSVAYVALENAGTAAEFYVVDVNRHSAAYGSVVGAVDFSSYPAIVSEEDSAVSEDESCVYAGEISISPDGAICLIQDACSDLIYMVDILPGSPTQNAVVDTICMPRVTEIAFHPGGEYAYVTSAFLLRAYVLDMNPESSTFGAIVNSIELPSPHANSSLICHPLALDFAPDGSRCLVLGKDFTENQPYIHTLDTTDPMNPVQIGVDLFGEPFPMSGTKAIRISPRGDRCVVALNDIGLMNLDISERPYEVLDHFADDFYGIEVETGFAPDGENVFVLSAAADSLITFDFGDAASVSLASGDGQTGVAGEILPAGLKVRVIDGSGEPAAGIAVTFLVTEGGGSFVGTGTPLAIAATDPEGIANVAWRLGPNLGVQRVSAFGYGLAGSPVGFSAEAVENPAELPLELADLAPATGAAEVSVTTAIKGTFSRAVDPATVDASAFSLRKADDSSPVPVSYGFTSENREVSLAPLVNLEFGAEYVIEISGALLDADGGPVQNPLASSFTTSASVPPALDAVSPPGAVAYTPVILSGEGFDAVPSNNTVLFNDVPATPVAGGFDYLEVKVPAGIESALVRVVVGPDTSNAVAFAGLVPEFEPIDEVIATVNTGYATQAVAVTSDGSRAYAISPESDVAVPVDLVNLASLAPISVGDHPVSIAMHPRSTFAFVANFGSGTVSEIDVDPASPYYHSIRANLPVEANPIDLAVSPEGDRLYVVNAGSASISIIDTDEESETYHEALATVETESAVNCVAVAPDGSRIYIGTDSGFIVLDPMSYAVLARISTGSATKTVTIVPDGTLMFLLTDGGEVFVVDIEPGSATENAVVAHIGVGSTVSSVTIKADGTLLYLIQEESDVVLVVLIELLDAVAVLDPGEELPPKTVRVSVVDSLWAGEDPTALAFDPTGSGLAYVTNAGPRTITVLNVSEVPYITCTVAAPPDTFVSVPPEETYIFFDFGITNTSPNYDSEFDYQLSTDGPGFLAWGESDGRNVLFGTTPLLAPGESHVVTGAALVIPDGAVFGSAEQIVAFSVSAHEYPERRQSAQTVFSLVQQVVAVLVTKFEAVAVEGCVRLSWDISADGDVEGFNVYRSEGDAKALVNEGGLLPPDARTCADFEIAGGRSYAYTLGIVTSDGNEMTSLEAFVQTKRCSLALRQNFPNPFNPATRISFSLPERTHVKIHIYNSGGELIATLADGVLEEGLREVEWNGRDERGNVVASGVYFCRLVAGKQTLTRKMVLLR